MTLPVQTLNSFFNVSDNDQPVCVMTGEAGSWCQLYPGHDYSVGNYVPLAGRVNRTRLGEPDHELFSFDCLASNYDNHLRLTRANLAYASARVATSLQSQTADPRDRLSHGVDWVQKTIHAIRHSFRSDLIEHTLRRDLLWRQNEFIQDPLAAHRLSMELSSLLNERGHHGLAKSFLELATLFVSVSDLEQLAAETGEFTLPLNYYRRFGQILLHSSPQDNRWKDFLKTAKDFCTIGNTSFQVVEANLNALGAFHNQCGFKTALARFEELRSRYAPRMVTADDFQIENFPNLTTPAARAEFFLFSGVTLAASRGSSEMVLAHLRLSDRLFDRTCHHALAPFYWEAICNVMPKNKRVCQYLGAMRTRRTQKKGLAREALNAIGDAREWLKRRRPRESKFIMSNGGTMNFNQSHFHDCVFIEDKMPVPASQTNEMLDVIARIKAIEPLLPVAELEHETLKTGLFEGERQVTSKTPSKGILSKAFGQIATILASIPSSVIGNLTTDQIRPELSDLLTRVHHLLTFLNN